MNAKSLRYFIKICTKANIEESMKEEAERYSLLPYNNRIIKYIETLQKFKLIEGNKE